MAPTLLLHSLADECVPFFGILLTCCPILAAQVLRTLAANELSKEQLALLQSTSMLGQAITLDSSHVHFLCV